MTPKKTDTPTKEPAAKGPSNANLADAIRKLATNQNQTEEQQADILALLGDKPKVHSREG